MAENDVRALFAAFDEGPPLGIDPDDIISRGERIRARRKRLKVATSAVVTACAIAAVTFLGGSVGSRQEPARPAGPDATATTPTTPTTTTITNPVHVERTPGSHHTQPAPARRATDGPCHSECG